MKGTATRAGIAEDESPPVAATTEGLSIAVEANADVAYNATGVAGKDIFVRPEQGANSAVHPREWPMRHHRPFGAFRSNDGRVWRYRGKRARVLAMLATDDVGVTQWDTLPWHTRFGGTIHALRCDGPDISTELEGEYRHARYRLLTAGSLLPDNATEQRAAEDAGRVAP